MGVVLVVNNFLLSEPKSNLLLGVFNAVGSVADVSSGDDAEVSSDGAGVGLEGVGGSQKESSGGNNSSAFPDHADDWA